VTRFDPRGDYSTLGFN